MESLNYVRSPSEQCVRNDLMQWGRDTHFTNTPHSTSPTRQTGGLPRILSPSSGQVLKAWSGSWDGDFSSDDDEPADYKGSNNGYDGTKGLYSEKRVVLSDASSSGVGTFGYHEEDQSATSIEGKDSLIRGTSSQSKLSKQSSFKGSFKIEKLEGDDLKTSLSKYSSWGSGYGSFRTQVRNIYIYIYIYIYVQYVYEFSIQRSFLYVLLLLSEGPEHHEQPKYPPNVHGKESDK